MRGAALALSAALAAALGVCAAISPSAAFGASNVASTEAYVRANYALVSTGHSLVPTAEARIRALRERLRRECPHVVAGSPQNEDSEKLTWEVIGAMTIVGYEPGAAAAAKFARAVSRLNWSNAALTRAVHSYARRGLAEVRTPLPDLCGDLRAWRASGYKALPATTVRFRKTFYENYVGVGFMPRSLLAYVPSSQRALVQRARRYEEAIAETEAREVETFGEIIDLLGLNQ
ncbi:MAG TPA: hypothetical protein VN672_04270 [Solirubrobacteraceae bacterium]|nr:hypothetical protein [Solirubrobacteraceae bacterium]